MAADPRPFPPGEYPVIVIGSGPGGLQLSYGLKHYGVPHAVLSADPSPGGMFRRWPFFQRLLSWTKPYAPEALTSREYQRYDWNSLIAFEPELRSLQAQHMDGSSYFPSRPEMEASLAAFADQAGIAVRYGCRWERTRRDEGPDGTVFTLETTDGEYRCRNLVLAVGIAEPWSPSPPGIEHARHYAQTRDADVVRGQAAVHHRQAELRASSSRPGCRPGRRRSRCRRRRPRRRRSRPSRWSASAPGTCSRSRTTSSGLGVSILDASIDGIEPIGDAFRVNLKRTDNGEAMSVEADEVIAATGFTCPLQDLADLGVTTFGQAKLPSVTPMWESATVPGIFFAGTISSAAPGLKKHGIPSYSGAVQGHRYNGLVLARHIAETRFGVAMDRPAVAPSDVLAVPAPGGDLRARAVAPEGLPRPGAVGVARTTGSATRGSCRSCTRSTR